MHCYPYHADEDWEAPVLRWPFSISGLPAGVTAGFSPTSVASPGSGTSTLRLSAGSGAASGTYSVVITASGGGVSRTEPLSLNIPGYTLVTSRTSVSLAPGARGTLTVTPHLVAGFNSAIVLSAPGLPSGVTASFSPPTVSAPGGGTSSLTVARAAGNTTVATSQLTITAIGGGVTRTAHITVNRTAK